jgi:hypothetical protein
MTKRMMPALALCLATPLLVGVASTRGASRRGASPRADSLRASSAHGGGGSVASATLTHCVTAVSQSERSATFAGEMSVVPGGPRMQMRTDILRRRPDETHYHVVDAPGLGRWREAEAGVKTYKDLRQVTNLLAPASYRARVRFRWLNPHGHVVKRIQLHTARCVQPAVPPPAVPMVASAPRG